MKALARPLERQGEGTPGCSPQLAISLRCSFCHDGLGRQAAIYCASCLAPHHADCFRHHGRCSALGCQETSFVRRDGRAPAQRWRLALVLGALLTFPLAAFAMGRLAEASEPPRPAQGHPLIASELVAWGLLRVGELELPLGLRDGDRLFADRSQSGFVEVTLRTGSLERPSAVLAVAEPGVPVSVLIPDCPPLRLSPKVGRADAFLFRLGPWESTARGAAPGTYLRPSFLNCSR